MVLGSTGQTGLALVDALEQNENVEMIICLNRKHYDFKPGLTKVRQFIVQDFKNKSLLDQFFTETLEPFQIDVAFCALGSSPNRRSKVGCKSYHINDDRVS